VSINRDGNYWFWIPIVAPHIGALLGGITYMMMITANLPAPDDKQSKSRDNGSVDDIEGVKLQPINE